MREHPWPEQLRVRLQDVKALWWTQVQWAMIMRWWSGEWETQQWIRTLYPVEFFHPVHSVGVLWLVWLPIAIVVNLCSAGVRSLRQVSRPASERESLLVANRGNGARARPALVVLAGAAASLTLNVALRWDTPLTHALPYLDVLLIAAMGVYLLRWLGLLYWLIAAAAIVTRQAQYFIASAETSALGLPAFDANGLLFWISCAILLAGGLSRSGPTVERAVPVT